jgi:peptidoglycan-associated lipoprotein
MPYLHFVSSRTTLASAALFSLAVLAGCESTTSTGASDTQAAAGTGNLAPTNGPTSSDLGSLDDQIRSVGDRVHFALDRYDLPSDAQATLQQQAALLQSHPEVAVTIQGHADERGTREYNLALGERRADSVRNYLIPLGIPAERISVISYGKERPECADAAESCWAQNRRGVTTVNQ